MIVAIGMFSEHFGDKAACSLARRVLLVRNRSRELSRAVFAPLCVVESVLVFFDAKNIIGRTAEERAKSGKRAE